LEKYNKRTGKWESVEIDLSDPEILETLEIMSSEMAITIKKEKMSMGLDKINDEESN
jgi:2-oxo-4-hydroxy-4-carboxy--5-ureidoimidazoline (OHCU) decarboxylase